MKPAYDFANAVIFLLEDPFTQRDYQRYGFDIFIKHGKTPWVFDLGAIVQPIRFANRDKGYRAPYDKVLVLTDKKKAKDLVELAAKGGVFFMGIPFSRKSLWLYWWLERLRAVYAVGKNSIHPRSSDLKPRSLLSQVMKAFVLCVKDTELFLYLIMSRVPKSWLGIHRGATYVITGGRGAVAQRPHAMTSYSRVIRCHAMDYDLFLAARASSQELQQVGKIVFLDQYLPYHPELETEDPKRRVAAEIYFSELKSVFAKMEESYGIPVVIAAHPRAEYHDKGDCFGGRDIVYGQSIQVVKDASFVIAHTSTAINFAVLFKKPIFFVGTSEFSKDPELITHMSHFADLLGRKLIFPTDLTAVNWEQERKIDEIKYDSYVDMYIKEQGSEDKNTWEIFCDTLELQSQ